MPFEATLNNKHIGIIEEYLVEISKNLDIELNFVPTLNWHESFEKVVENKCDILTTIADKKIEKSFLILQTLIWIFLL